jgi:cytochrome P450
LKPLFGERSMVVLEPAEHLERRRLLLPSFHSRSVRAHASAITDVTEAALADWAAGDVVEVLPFAQRVALDVILRSLLGVSNPVTRDALRSVFDSMVSLPGSSVAGYFPRLGKRTRWNIPAERYWRLRDSLDATLTAQIAASRSDPALEERGDILAMLMRVQDGEGNRALSDEDLRDELKALITAGHETTGTGVAWAAELLAHHPEVQETAREAALRGDDEYLDALVREVLRMRTPVPVGATRRVTEPFELSGYTIPPGVPILVNAYGLHHDPVLYPEPERLNVERFLGNARAAQTYVPFGGGARRCIGAGLAQLELRLVLGVLLRRFVLMPTADEVARPVRRGITLVPANSARVRLAT